jgi:DNA-binding response OmpR family regulator
VKPYELREMLARVRSILRRLPAEAATAVPEMAPAGGKRIRFGGMALDVDGRALTDASGAPVDLTPMELELLCVLATRPGRPLSRGQIIELAGGGEGDTERAVDIRVTRLRRKIEPNPEQPRYIKTVRGTGYVFLGD